MQTECRKRGYRVKHLKIFIYAPKRKDDEYSARQKFGVGKRERQFSGAYRAVNTLKTIYLAIGRGSALDAA